MKTTTIPPPAARPRCRQCGKTLQMETFTMTAPTGSPPPIGAVLLARSDGSQFYNRGITAIRNRVLEPCL